MASNPRITLFDKLSLLLLAVGAVTSILFRLVTAVFHNGPKASKPLKDAVFAGLRYLSSNYTVAQEQYKNGGKTTMKEYLSYAKQNSLQPETTALRSGLKLCWIGPKDAENVLLYFHGGGYINAASPGHMQWAAELQKTCSKPTRFSVVFAAYTQATPDGGSYPVQLQEAAEALHWLVETQNMKPSNVMIGGDSAGGHLCISLLSHLLHPHPEATRIDLKEPLQSAILISPWVSFQVDDASWADNYHSDYLTPTAAQRWSSIYLGGSTPDNYNVPIRADGEWFSGLDTVVKDLLIWGGGAEVFIDSIKKFVGIVESAHPKTHFVVQKGASHVDPVVDLVLRYGEHESVPLFRRWISERI